MKTARRRSQRKRFIRGIYIRFRMTFDAAVAVWLLRSYGGHKYHGIQTAPLMFLRERDLPGGLSAAEWEKKGYLAVNCGESRFDHHPHGKYRAECAATLVMRHLGIYDSPTLQKIKEWVLWDDLRRKDTIAGRPARQEMAFTAARTFLEQQNLFDWSAGDEELMECLEKAFEYLCVALNVHVDCQEKFFRDGKEEFEAGEVVRIPQSGARDLLIAVMETERDYASKYARSEYGCQADITVELRANGQVQICSNCHTPLDFSNLAARLRYLELSYRDPEVLQEIIEREGDNYDSYMSQEGTIPEVEEWYYMKPDDPLNTDASSMMLNGSKSHPYVPATNIPANGENSIVSTIIESFSK